MSFFSFFLSFFSAIVDFKITLGSMRVHLYFVKGNYGHKTACKRTKKALKGEFCITNISLVLVSDVLQHVTLFLLLYI